MNRIKYFVISLPRTGTVSISKMAKLCGLSPKHAPIWNLNREVAGNSFNFFSDTPVFCLSNIEKFCLDKTLKSKFIFIDKPFDQIFSSWKRMNLFANYTQLVTANKDKLSSGQKFDLRSYQEAFNDRTLNETNFSLLFDDHKTSVLNKVKEHNKDLLIYTFDQGWEPFCKFIGAEIPSAELPHLNKTTMFDKI